MKSGNSLNEAVGPEVTPIDGMVVTRDLVLKRGVYYLPRGIRVEADGVTIDGNGAMLVGDDRKAVGLRLEGRRNVTVRNLRMREYFHGIHASRCTGLRIDGNQIASTAEIPTNTIFLDIWKKAEVAYGGAILLSCVEDSQFIGNDLQHQMNGLLTYGCKRLTVRDNVAGYNSGYGFHLFDTCDSLFEANYADYCCRYEPRDAKPPSGGAPVVAATASGHMGADATGFLIVHNSCNNTFRGNYARLGGDGFFLAGLAPDLSRVPCNDNLFEGNDASLSPNIAFEATFSSGNVFRGNRADRCNYGFWLGFSSRNTIENNRVMWNRQAGIAVENGSTFTVRGNDFQRNGHGVLMWSKWVDGWYDAFPDNRTCHHWTIEGNTFTRNDKAICIAADKDHGIRPMPAEACGRPELRPHDNGISSNDIQDNRTGVELHGTDRTTLTRNTINRNVECNVRREDDLETMVRDNLGTGGAYL